MQESSKLKKIPVVIMSSENVPTRISRYFYPFIISLLIRAFLCLIHTDYRALNHCSSIFALFDWLLTRCLEEGAEDFLVKPVRPSDVSRLFSRVLP